MLVIYLKPQSTSCSVHRQSKITHMKVFRQTVSFHATGWLDVIIHFFKRVFLSWKKKKKKGQAPSVFSYLLLYILEQMSLPGIKTQFMTQTCWELYGELLWICILCFLISGWVERPDALISDIYFSNHFSYPSWKNSSGKHYQAF